MTASEHDGAFRRAEGASRWHRWIAFAVAAAAVALFVRTSFRPHADVDDAYISYRYARNLVVGNGLVFNIGERVEGMTNLGWTLLVAAGFRMGIDAHYFADFLGVVTGAAALWLAYVYARAATPGRLAWTAALAPWLVLATTAFPVWATSGLETPLFAALATAALITQGRGSLAGTAVVCAAATLVRPEGALLAAVVFGFDLRRDPRRRATWFAMGGYAAFVVGLTVFRLVYFGMPLPNTFYVKVRPIPVSWPTLYLSSFCVQILAPLALPAVLGALREPALRVGAAWLVALMAYTFAVGGDAFDHARFLVPALPALAALAVRGASTSWEDPSLKGRVTTACIPIALLWFTLGPAFGATALGLATLLLLAPRIRQSLGLALLATAIGVAGGALFRKELSKRFTASPNSILRVFFASRADEIDRTVEGRTYFDVMAQIVVRNLNRLEPRPEFIATGGLGELGYYLPVRLVDIFGLIDPDVRHLTGDVVPGTMQIPGHQWSNAAHVLAMRPDCIMEMPRIGSLNLPAVVALWQNVKFREEYVHVPEAQTYCRRSLGFGARHR